MVIRTQVLDRNTDDAAPLNGLAAKLNEGVMQRKNALVDVDKKSVEEVATACLKSNGLI